MKERVSVRTVMREVAPLSLRGLEAVKNYETSDRPSRWINFLPTRKRSPHVCGFAGKIAGPTSVSSNDFFNGGAEIDFQPLLAWYHEPPGIQPQLVQHG